MYKGLNRLKEKVRALDMGDNIKLRFILENKESALCREYMNYIEKA